MIIVGVYVGLIVVMQIMRKNQVKEMKLKERKMKGWKIERRVVIQMVKKMVMIFIVIGKILIGVEKKKEGGEMGEVGEMMIEIIKGRIKMKMMKQEIYEKKKI